MWAQIPGIVTQTHQPLLLWTEPLPHVFLLYMQIRNYKLYQTTAKVLDLYFSSQLTDHWFKGRRSVYFHLVVKRHTTKTRLCKQKEFSEISPRSRFPFIDTYILFFRPRYRSITCGHSSIIGNHNWHFDYGPRMREGNAFTVSVWLCREVQIRTGSLSWPVLPLVLHASSFRGWAGPLPISLGEGDRCLPLIPVNKVTYTSKIITFPLYFVRGL